MAAALVMAVQARASWYNITFNGSDVNFVGTGSQFIPGTVTTANGQIDVANNMAISGFLDITAGDNKGHYALVPGSGSDTQFLWDDAVYPGSTPFLSSTGGVLWWTMGTIEIEMWYNTDPRFGPTELYALWGAPPNSSQMGTDFDPTAFGTATLTPVPEPTTIIAGALLLLPFGASTLRILRRKTRTA